MMLIFYRYPCVATVFDYCFPSVFFLNSPFMLRNHSMDLLKIFRNCVSWYDLNQGCNIKTLPKTGLNNPVVLKLFRRHLVEIVN